MLRVRLTLLIVLFGFCHGLVFAEDKTGQPTPAPIIVVPQTKEVRVSGVIYPKRFNTAQGEEAHYHLLAWQGGTSSDALIETAADDLAFHDALLKLGAQPGDNLTMESWTQRHDIHSAAPQAKVTGSPLDIRLSWASNPTGISITQAFRQSTIDWRFGGNRARWFNQVPLAPRPGCLACLYSCPSGKVSNGALSIHDYVTTPTRFHADTDMLPPDGTPVTVTFRRLP